MAWLISFAKKTERFFQFIGTISIILSALLFISTIQRNADSDVTTAWQLLAAERPGNLGRAQAVNTLASSHCLVKYGPNRIIDSYGYDYFKKVPQCLISGAIILNGPQSLGGINLSSNNDGVSLLDRLSISDVDLGNASFERSSLRNGLIANSRIYDANFVGSHFTLSKLVGNLFSSAKLDCTYINRTTFHSNVFKKVTMDFSRIVFSHIDLLHSYDDSNRSFSISLKNSYIIDSFFDLSGSYGSNMFRSKVIRSHVIMKDVKYLQIEEADFSNSFVEGDLSGNVYSTFKNSNISGVDMRKLEGLGPDELKSSYFCNGNPPFLPQNYSGERPKEKQCIPTIPEKVFKLLQELSKQNILFGNRSPLRVFYMATGSDEESKRICNINKTAVDNLFPDSGILLLDKGTIVPFNNISSETPIAAQLIQVGDDRGAETRNKTLTTSSGP